MMRLPRMDYIAPTTVREACYLLAKDASKTKVLAGGTDLLVACKLRNSKPTLLVSLGKIEELKGIDLQENELRIGAMTSLYEIRNHSVIIKQYPALAQASASVGTLQLQYMGTLGGNLCLNTRCIYYNQSDSWRKSRAVCLKMGGETCHVIPKGKRCYAVYSGDTAPALMALDARVKIISDKGERVIPLKDLYTNDGKEPIAVKPGEVLSEIRIPLPIDQQGSRYLKYRQRGAIDFPLVGVAVRLNSNETGLCTDCKIVMTAISSGPREAFEAEELLKGKALDPDLILKASQKAMKEAHPVANTSGDTEYRRKMSMILTHRALNEVAKDIGLI